MKHLAGPLRVLRAYWPVYALVAVGALCACLYGLVAAPFAPEVRARGDGSTLTLPDGRLEVTVYGDAAAPDDVTCTVAPPGDTRVGGLVLGDRVVDGRELEGLVEVRGGWADGATLTCPGTQALVAMTGSPTQRIGFVVLTGLLAAGAGAFALVGLRLSRRPDDPSSPPRGAAA